MSFVKLTDVNMIYDNKHHILKDLNLSIEKGNWFPCSARVVVGKRRRFVL